MWALLFSVKSIAIIAAAVLLHEAAHFAMCLHLGVKILAFTPLPWGMSIHTPLIDSPRMQLAISAAGPLCNFAVLALCCAVRSVFGINSADFGLFMLANFADGFLNLLPALPLDGGIILKSRLCIGHGLAGGFKTAINISAAIGVLIFLFGVGAFLESGYNFSYMAAGVFILSNLKHERQLLMCIKKRVFTGEIKSAQKIRYITVDENCNAICLASLISCSYTLIFLVNSSDRFLGEVTQEELIKKLFENSLITVGECIEKF